AILKNALDTLPKDGPNRGNSGRPEEPEDDDEDQQIWWEPPQHVDRKIAESKRFPTREAYELQMPQTLLPLRVDNPEEEAWDYENDPELAQIWKDTDVTINPPNAEFRRDQSNKFLLRGAAIVPPIAQRRAIFAAIHEAWGHCGSNNLDRLTRTRYWWKAMKTDAVRYTETCPI